jgi:hypothetical protein
MIFLERGRELIAAQVVEKEMLLSLLIDIILVVWGCEMGGHLRNKIYKISAAGKEIFSIYLFVVLCFILVLLLSYIVYGIHTRIVW